MTFVHFADRPTEEEKKKEKEEKKKADQEKKEQKEKLKKEQEIRKKFKVRFFLKKIASYTNKYIQHALALVKNHPVQTLNILFDSKMSDLKC